MESMCNNFAVKEYPKGNRHFITPKNQAISPFHGKFSVILIPILYLFSLTPQVLEGDAKEHRVYLSVLLII